MRQVFAARPATRSAATTLAFAVMAGVFGTTAANAREPAGLPPASSAERDLIERAKAEQAQQLEAQRQDELSKLSEKLRKAREARGAAPAATPSAPSTGWQTEVLPAPAKPKLDTSQRFALGAGPAVVQARDAGRATILMVMTPGTKGIRRFDAVADPVLCMDDGCYISQGPSVSAEMRGRGGVLGFQNTWGERAGACRNQLGCVFRDIDVGTGSAMIAPVDMRVVRHDRRPTTVVAIDESCKVNLDRITCNRPYVGDGYTVWVVPEGVAREAGSERLQRAVDRGLSR